MIATQSCITVPKFGGWTQKKKKRQEFSISRHITSENHHFLYLLIPTFANVTDQAPDIKAAATFDIWNVNGDMVNCQQNVKSASHRNRAPKQM